MTNTSKLTLAAAALAAAFTVGCTTNPNSREFYPTAEQRYETEMGAARIQKVEADARKIQHEERMSRAKATELSTRNAPKTQTIYVRPRYYW